MRGAVLDHGAALVAVLDGGTTTVAGAATLAPGASSGLGRRRLVSAGAGRPLVLASLVEIGLGVGLLVAGWYLRFAPSADRHTPHPLAAAAALVTGTLMAAIGSHVGLVVVGVILAASAGHLFERVAGGPKLPLAPAATILLLPAWWLMATIAGPEGSRWEHSPRRRSARRRSACWPSLC